MRSKRVAGSGVLVALALVLMAGIAAAQAPSDTPLGTGFTYQGQLKSDDTPYTGVCDFKFGLFDSLAGGNQEGLVTETNRAVVKGLFTVQLDFGAGKFVGEERWLEISVRCPAGSGGYQLLSPRQPLTAAPYALHATNSNRLGGYQAGAFAAASHNHWGASWSGSGAGLTLGGGAIGLAGSGTTYGVSGTSATADGRGVYGEATATSGLNRGVEGKTLSSQGTGVVGHAAATSGYNHGVWGQSDSTLGKGVVGVATANSGTTVGVLGQASSGVSWGVAGHNEQNGAGIGAWSDMGDLIQAYDGDFPGGQLRFKVDQAGNVHYDGSLMPIVSLSAAGSGQPERVSLYGLTSTEVWFEDLGSASLAAGRAEVAIDPTFARTVNLAETYQVYLTATCQEAVLLFVSEKTAAHFVVEGVNLKGEPSSCGFSYRLAAKRLGHEALRLEAVAVPVQAAEKERQP